MNRTLVVLPLFLAGACAPQPNPAFDMSVDAPLTDDVAGPHDEDSDDATPDAETTESSATDSRTTDDTTSTTTTTSSPGCPAGVVCIEQFPFQDTGTTSGAASNLEAYSCASTIDESGPEVVYQVVLDQAGYLAAEVWGLGSGVDVDVHLLESVDANDCIDRGHWSAGALLMPGTYYVVVDSWVDANGDAKDGAYSLDVHVTTRDAYASSGLDADVLERALFAFDGAWFEGETDTFVYGVIDFTMPSDEHRFFVMDLARGELLFEEYVAHGSGSQDPSDARYANAFSNVHESHMSSLGMVRAAETYTGTYGYSVRLDGLDGTYNDNVRSRAIVIHPWDYSSDSFVSSYGYAGQTWGCPGIDPAISMNLVNTLADGALILKYSDANDFLTYGRFMPGF